MEVLSENAQYYIEELERDLHGSRAPEETERLLYDLSFYHRLAAIGAFFSAVDVTSFASHLRRSAELRIRLLKQARENGSSTSRFACASRTAPFFDAIAAGEMELAKAIATLSSLEWAEDDEFEDDFWYARFMYALHLHGSEPVEEVSNALANLERVEAEVPSARADLCRALSARDQTQFDDALHAIIEERAAHYESKAGVLVPNRLAFESGRLLFVEGLAILRLAESIGLETAPEYQFMPYLARVPIDQ